MASGTNKHSRYHPDYLPFGEIPSDSSKSYPLTRANVFHYWEYPFTEPTRESDCQNLPHRLAPPAGSLQLSESANFPSQSLRYVFL